MNKEKVINMTLSQGPDFQKNESDYTKHLMYKKFVKIFKV